MGYLCKKTPEEITSIISDKRLLAADLRNYSNEFVLTSARDRVIGEVDEEGKELLKDVDPERDVIKQRFEDETSVFKSYDDAIHDIRVDLFLDGIKPRKQEEVEENTDTSTLIAELNAVLQVWDTLYKRIEVEPRRGGRATQGPYPSRGGKPVGPPGTRSHPYATGRYPAASPPHFGPPFAGSPHHNAPPYPRGHRDYHERPPYRDEYYPDRRDDYRRPDYDRRDPRDHPIGMRGHGLIPLGRPDSRDMRDTRDHRDFRDWSGPPGARNDGRYDDRRRDRPEMGNIPPLRDGRHHGMASANVSPMATHPSLPPKPHGAHQAANNAYSQQYTPMPHHPAADHQSAQAGYGAYGQQPYAVPGQHDYSAYQYSGYGQDPATIAAHQQYAYPAGATGTWDMTAGATATATAAAAAAAGLHIQPFTSVQPGRHKAVPLPTDFMSGPSDAPRLSMPEPHQVLGTIRGIIIRDAHGNIGLSQYHFTQAT
ncbi:hypothetical protein BGZ51_009183 [Haplosporangium sp. Z 767]|nr:hypothetical protein BGZ51_009183 [Haplosporangium sp. Z 767]